MTPRPTTLMPVFAVVAAFAGCGQSSTDKAADTVHRPVGLGAAQIGQIRDSVAQLAHGGGMNSSDNTTKTA
jgi:hypothetical protein